MNRILSANIKERRFVSKNLTHTLYFNKSTMNKYRCEKQKNRGEELLYELADLYLENHRDKKFHDPTSAICHFISRNSNMS